MNKSLSIEPQTKPQTEKPLVAIAVTRFTLEPFIVPLQRCMEKWLQSDIERGSWGMEIDLSLCHENFLLVTLRAKSLAAALTNLIDFGRRFTRGFANFEVAFRDDAEGIWRTHLEEPRIYGDPFDRFMKQEFIDAAKRKMAEYEAFNQFLLARILSRDKNNSDTDPE